MSIKSRFFLMTAVKSPNNCCVFSRIPSSYSDCREILSWCSLYILAFFTSRGRDPVPLTDIKGLKSKNIIFFSKRFPSIPSFSGYTQDHSTWGRFREDVVALAATNPFPLSSPTTISWEGEKLRRRTSHQLLPNKYCCADLLQFSTWN